MIKEDGLTKLYVFCTKYAQECSDLVNFTIYSIQNMSIIEHLLNATVLLYFTASYDELRRNEARTATYIKGNTHEHRRR